MKRAERCKITKEEIEELYINQNLAIKDVANLLNCSPFTLNSRLKKFGIKKSKELVNKQKEQVFIEHYGYKNPLQLKEIREKQKQTCLEKYGVQHPLQNKNIKEKQKQTCLKKYGVQHPLQNKEIKKRTTQTNLERYGVENPSQSKEIREKQKKTCKKNYGVEYPLQNKNIKEKQKQTNLKKYGVEHLLQSEEIKEKAKQTCLNHYGVECSLLAKEVQDKIKQTNLEKYGVENASQKHLSKETLEILSDKEKLKDFILNSDNKNGFYLAEKLKVNSSGFYRTVHSYGLFDLLDHFSSKYEQEIKEYFEQKGIKLEKTRDILKPFEIDLYDPIHKIGIEFNGDYWHSDQQKDKFYHQMKSLLAESKEITLFHIWEHEWIFNKNKILMMLDNLFGLSESIYARNCKIVEIPSKDKSKFLNENHLQGNDGSSVNLALVHKNILVSVMTFCKPRFNKNYEYELSRFCNLAGYRVIGGASKLFKYFVNHYKPNSIISYSNISKTTGKLYKNLGFKLERISDPNYVWINTKFDIKTRYQCQMKNEKQIMTDKGYFRIYDCGNKVWSYE